MAGFAETFNKYRALVALCLVLVFLTAAEVTAGCGGSDEDPDQVLDEARRKVEEATTGLINQSYTVTATELSYPYVPADESFAPEPGYQYVLVTVSVKNTGENPVVASYRDFTLETDDGERFLAAMVTDLQDDFGAARSPIPGSEETGTLAFEIPDTAAPVALWEEIGPEPNKVTLPAQSQ